MLPVNDTTKSTITRVSVDSRFLSAFFMAGILCPTLSFAQNWTQFAMNRGDEQGRFLWTDTQNWNRGVPDAKTSVEIGDDKSGKALHCVIPTGTGATCAQFELAEHARTQGTTLRLELGASLTVLGGAVLSKDRESWFYVDGTFVCQDKRWGIRVGGPWGRPDIGEPASCHLIIGPEGRVEASGIGINTSFRSDTTPSAPWGEKFYARSTDSEITVDGGQLIADQGLKLSTTDARRPGTLRLKGNASFLSQRDSQYGIDVWCGVWEIVGGDVTIKVGDIEFHGDKFKDEVNGRSGKAVGGGNSVLKLTGTGISTIHARKLNFVSAALLDVSDLTLPAGTYTVIDGAEIRGDQLQLAAGADLKKWSIRFDRDRGDLLITFSP